ncbi:MAG: PorV/PorQ family protein [Bacteroidota bacterium]|nr:PorV/PorQ family protein [Bacteroidota bacterium]
MEKMNKVLIIFLVLLGFGIQTLSAGNKSRTGTAGAQELLIPVGAAGIALGNANIATASGVDAIYWNPAGIARSDRGSEVMISHMQYFGDIALNYGAVSIDAGSFGRLAFSMKSLSFGDIPVTTESFPDGTGDSYSPTYVTLGVSYGKQLSDRISVGTTINVVSENIMSTSASGFVLNAGVQYHGLIIPELKLGIAVKNVGPSMKYDGSNLMRTAAVSGATRAAQLYKVDAAEFDLPSTIEMGLAYERKLDDMNAFSVMTNFQNNNYQADEYKFGAEYAYNNLIFVRGGYLSSPNADVNEYLYDYTFGFGVHYDLGSIDVNVDYAFRHLKYMDSNNVITVKLGF